MADLIDRQTVVDMLQRLAYDDWNQGTSTTWANAYSECADMVENLPSVDAVKVIRCEQCMHYNSIDFHCYYHGSICFKPNDYCPYGRVRDDG